MPIARSLHCMTLLQPGIVFIFGGKTFNKSHSSTAQIYNFNTKKWTMVPRGSPCGYTSVLSTHTICEAIKKSTNNGQVEVIIPYIDISTRSPCTAIFQWPEKTWSRMHLDHRRTPLGGALASFDGNTRLVHLGGFEENGNPSKLIYEYEGINDGWRLWHREVPAAFANATFTNIGIEFCQHSIDLKRMTMLDPNGELEPGKVAYKHLIL